jgi:hypothetical protein
VDSYLGQKEVSVHDDAPAAFVARIIQLRRAAPAAWEFFGVPGGAGFPPGTGPNVSIDLFLPGGTAQTQKRIDKSS